MFTPSSRPTLPRESLVKVVSPILAGKGLDKLPQLLIVGVRGYYAYGKEGNDRGVYDDAIFVLSPNALVGFNANVDPSIHKLGIASLATGLHWYKKGMHKGKYWALRPATPDEGLPVTRDGQTGLKRGIAINIHKGGYTSTSSLGCQTIHPDQWQAFKTLVYSEMDRLGLTKVPYLLITEDKL